MVPDYFSVYRDSSDNWLLRIHLKVDFTEEVVWAHNWSNTSSSTHFEEITRYVMSYLESGFDDIESWSGDEESWHESIKHYGYALVVDSMTLIPAIISGLNRPETDTFWTVFQRALLNKTHTLAHRVLPTRTDAIYQAMKQLNIPCPPPYDATATVGIPLSELFNKDWASIAKKMEDYSR